MSNRQSLLPQAGNVLQSPSNNLRNTLVLAVVVLIAGAGVWSSTSELTFFFKSKIASSFKAPKTENLQAKPASIVANATAVTSKDQISAPVKGAESSSPATDDKSEVITTIKDSSGKDMLIYERPVPKECNMVRNIDYDGAAVQWGLGHKAESAAECCRRCRDFAKDKPCNVWVWCGDPSGVCWTVDIHNHTTGDCWLKFQEGWDNNPDIAQSNLKINHQGHFSEAFRAEHKTAPLNVPWVAGVIVRSS